MSSISLDKFAEQILQMRDQANALDPGAASRIQVYTPTTAANPDKTYPDLSNLQIGAHFHRPNDQGEHTQEQSANWPQCVILQ